MSIQDFSRVNSEYRLVYVRMFIDFIVHLKNIFTRNSI